jgi:S1-C subfamily serine protease
MEPILARLAQEGCPVQVIDVNQQPDVVKQFQLTGVPTYVALSAGRETGRLVGATSYEKLVELYAGAGGRVQSPAPGAVQPTDYRAAEPRQPAANAAVASVALGAEQAARATTVRLKVEDAGGFGFGTGTIIDTHEGEALVVTCGHLFRESQGKGRISVDLFAAGVAQPVDGQLIAYDLDRDIALVAIRVSSPVQAAPVAPPGKQVKPGDRVFTIGCDKGSDPSVRATHITAVNKYLGRPNFTAAGQPVDGRSGGGLFTADGQLIGICNAADPADDEGVYAGLASIHWQLDQIGQSEIYQRTARTAVANSQPPAVPASFAATAATANEPAAIPQMPPQMPTANSSASESAPVAAANDDSEIVFIVRSKSNPQKQSEVYVVDQPAPDLIARITHAARTTGEQRAALAQARSNPTTVRPAAYQAPGSGPIVRGQSGD